jgi:hypothetical protein
MSILRCSYKEYFLQRMQFSYAPTRRNPIELGKPLSPSTIGICLSREDGIYHQTLTTCGEAPGDPLTHHSNAWSQLMTVPCPNVIQPHLSKQFIEGGHGDLYEVVEVKFPREVGSTRYASSAVLTP